MKTKWLKAELHNHTTHSDGRMSPAQLVECFAGRDTQILAISDHNSITGHAEFTQACQQHKVIPVLANEITTFWGHILGLGLTDYLDWSGFSPDNPEEICDSIHALGAICGLAHPFRLGFPVNTGCNWLMKIKDYSRFDYIEVMNTSDKGRCLNHVAVDFWLELLQSDIRTTAVAGKDWHGRPGDESPYCSYVGLSDRGVVTAVKSGAVYISCCGAVDVVAANQSGQCAIIGDTIADSTGSLLFSLEFNSELLFDQPLLIEVYDRDGLAFQSLQPFQRKLTFQPGSLDGFAVIKVFAGNQDFANLQFLSNPIYILSDWSEEDEISPTRKN